MLNMLGGMDTCDEGTILLDGSRISDYNQKELTRYRRYDVGFVFQFYNLVQNLTALENVELASEICENPLDIQRDPGHVGLERALLIIFPLSFPAASSSGSPLPGQAKNPKSWAMSLPAL